MRDKNLTSHERLLHISEAITSIENFTRLISEEDFLSDDLVNSAVLYQFLIIGEAVVHVDDEMLDKYEYPWYRVRSFRNLIAHEYFGIQMGAVWQIIQKDLPELKKLVETMLKNEF